MEKYNRTCRETGTPSSSRYFEASRRNQGTGEGRDNSNQCTRHSQSSHDGYTSSMPELDSRFQSLQPNEAFRFPQGRHSDLKRQRQPELIDLASKKRRLLQQSDWTGVSLQQPLTANYSRPAYRPILKPRDLRKLKEPSALNNMQSKSSSASQNDIRVRIGSQDYR